MSSVRSPLTAAAILVLLAACNSPSASNTEAPTSDQFLAQIEQAGAMSFSGDRASALKRVAGERLTQREQLSLVDVVQTSEMFSRDKREVLTAMISNPVTTPETLAAIRTKVLTMSMIPEDSDAVLEALAARPTP